MCKVTLIFILCLILSVYGQESGSFWWKNKKLMNQVSNSRSLKEQSAKIRTLPPRYRHENDDISSTTTVKGLFIHEEQDEENKDHSQYKYDNEPDCVCVSRQLCNENNTIITDGNGLIDERSFNLCGSENVCCRIPKTTISPPIPQKITTTTQRNLFNFDLTNLTNIISTILRPVNNSTFKPIKPQQPQVERSCISKKGKKLQERILINENNEDEDNELVGETTFAEYPWMIELLKKNPNTRNFEYKCGAVLINPTTALTANHCLKNKIPSNYLIRAGEWDRSSTLEYLQHQDRSLSQIISHPQYYSGGLFNDIAILKWIHPLNLDLNIQPICLPEENQIIKEGTKCIVSAWGKTSENTPTTDKLKFVKVPIVEHNKCQSQLQSYRLGNRFKLHESFICAGGDEGLDSCQNDGGSPLICKHGNDDSYFLTGLVSWGLDCGIKNVPGVYTSIPNLMRWIKTQITEK